MYQVSNAYLDKMMEQPKDLLRRIRGTVDNVSFTEANIVASSFEYIEKCIKSNDINLGGVFVGQLKLTFLPTFGTSIPRGSWQGRVITCSIGLLVDPDNDTWEDVPMKSYIIKEANHSKTGISVTAYDVMDKFDKPINISTTSGTIYEMASVACINCGVSLAQSESDMAQMPNGTEQLALYPENDIETWRDLISWLSITMGGYATINRNNALEFRVWHADPDIELDINDRQTGGSWSDFTTYYTGLSVVDISKEITRYYNVLPDTGLTMNIGSNPFMQYGLDETIARIAMAILTALQDFVYVPFNSSGLLDPCFDLGDVIEYTDGYAGGSSVCCVHSMDYKYYGGMKLIGYGKNPALFGARSKTDKNISGLLSRQSENEVVTHTFMNSAELTIDDTLTDILNIRFATISPRTIKLFHEINFDLDIDSGEDDAQITAYYYLNDDLIAFHPISSWDNDGNHILPLMYFLDNLTGGEQYTWRVALKCDRGTIHIDKQGIRALLEAQGLVATDEWDGYIEASDVVSAMFGGSFNVGSITESVATDERDVQFVTASDVVSATFGGSFRIVGVSESVSVIADKILYIIGSEDEAYILGSEDEQYQIESEE